MGKCRNCDCSHDGSIPGFDVGECNCHRIGGPYIQRIEHDYEEDKGGGDMKHQEADIVINGVRLDFAQAMTLRVALTNFLMSLQEPDALGEDEHGRSMVKSYQSRAGEIQDLIFRNLT